MKILIRYFIFLFIFIACQKGCDTTKKYYGIKQNIFRGALLFSEIRSIKKRYNEFLKKIEIKFSTLNSTERERVVDYLFKEGNIIDSKIPKELPDIENKIYEILNTTESDFKNYIKTNLSGEAQAVIFLISEIKKLKIRYDKKVQEFLKLYYSIEEKRRIELENMTKMSGGPKEKESDKGVEALLKN